MEALHFGINFLILLFLSVFLSVLLVFSIFFLRFPKVATQPALLFSNPKFLGTSSKNWRINFVRAPTWLKYLALGLFLLALLDPHYTALENQHSQKLASEGIAIYLMLDQSGSMGDKVSLEASEKSKDTKIDWMKKITKQFILDRPNDLIGLVAFARGARVLAPLTLDKKTLVEALNNLGLAGSRDHDGTAIGYALYKTAHLMAATRHFADELNAEGKKTYEIKSAVMILVTDGFQDPNPLDKGKRLRNLDLDEAGAFAKQQHIKLYIVNVEPRLATDEFAPHRRQMQRVAELTGGKFYLVGKEQSLKDIYKQINQLEKSTLFTDTNVASKGVRTFSFYPYLIFAGLLLIFSAIALETTLLRKVP